VLVCASCGHENGRDAKFCEECGFSFATATGLAKEHRKTVTVLFCDLTGSTALGEALDPERLRAVLARYFERMKTIVERHGGSVEKFIGDAVMAVFGVPVLHEDDALRAVRAAAEMREALPELGLQGRIGLTTGEVVTGTEERLATGDAVNVAARLEQAAQPGEVLLGQPTLALVEGAVDVEAVEPLVLKGKARPVPAYRLLRARDAPERRRETPFVGRERELRAVRAAWARVQADDRCEMLTLVGDAGVGKSRLAAELLASVDARVVRGRCLPYGEGITYWPVVEVLKQLGVLPTDEAAAAPIRSLLGHTDAATSAEELAWAFRKTLEHAAADRPLLVVFDDIQWGEETFLDLIEHVALLSSGAAILLLCIARPDLIVRRPAWPLTLRLEPLGSGDVAELIPERISAELREKIERAAGGNPLFIEEMVAMARESAGEVIVPPTLQALLAARLDQLDPAERSVLERGAIEGEIFHRGAVQALSTEGAQVTPRLAALVRQQVVRPDKTLLPGEDAFRFRHILFRDAAYDGLPKAVRAELHELFAAWLAEHGTALVELDELLGYHLEQAARYKTELGDPDPALAERAGERLATAGHGAASRGDNRAAASLFERALELTRSARLDVMLELDFADAISQDDGMLAATLADAAAERARVAGDATGELLARIGAAYYRLPFGAHPDVEGLDLLAREALPLLEEAENHAALAYVWLVLGYGVGNSRGRFEDWAHAAEQALRHARLVGRPRTDLFSLGDALGFGPRPAEEALRTLDAYLPDNPHPWPLLCRAWLLTMLARFDEADDLAREAGSRLRDLTGDALADIILGLIEGTAGRHEQAVLHLRRGCEMLEARGQRGYLAAFAPLLGRSLCALGRYDEAEPFARLGREMADDELDPAGTMPWRQVQALIEAHRGNYAEAEQLAREAVAIGDGTDGLNAQGDALSDLAEVLHAAGRRDEADVTFAQALERFERKQNAAQAAQVHERLAELNDAAQR
jgi:class 3 adenylate cyclase/tetratricopeptide (TPR) repeat protein